MEQFGLATMFIRPKPARASALTSGTTSGTSGCIRQAEELSITTQPVEPIFGDQALDTSPPADIRQMSVPAKS